MFGIVNLYKPVGLTSRQTLDWIAHTIEPVKAGHAGTLDPIASGVLLVCVGQATRLIEYVQQLPKSYRATFRLGCSSPSDDIENTVTEIPDAPQPNRLDIETVLPEFLGEILQTPPAFSAIKIQGQRAYKIARKGRDPKLVPRPVQIHSLVITHYEYPELVLEIECGSGTYVRSLGRDLAIRLGTAAVMTALERTEIGPFTSEDSVRLENDADRTARDNTRHTAILQALQPVQRALPAWPVVRVDDVEIRNLVDGRGLSTAFQNSILTQTKSREVSNENEIMPVAVNSRKWIAENSAGRMIALLQIRPERGIVSEMVLRPE